MENYILDKLCLKIIEAMENKTPVVFNGNEGIIGEMITDDNNVRVTIMTDDGNVFELENMDILKLSVKEDKQKIKIIKNRKIIRLSPYNYLGEQTVESARNEIIQKILSEAAQFMKITEVYRADGCVEIEAELKVMAY